MGGGADAFVRVSVPGKEVAQTKVECGTVAPTWNESFLIPLERQEVDAAGNVVIEVRHKGLFRKVLGSVTVDVNNQLFRGPSPQLHWFKLEGEGASG